MILDGKFEFEKWHERNLCNAQTGFILINVTAHTMLTLYLTGWQQSGANVIFLMICSVLFNFHAWIIKLKFSSNKIRNSLSLTRFLSSFCLLMDNFSCLLFGISNYIYFCWHEQWGLWDFDDSNYDLLTICLFYSGNLCDEVIRWCDYIYYLKIKIYYTFIFHTLFRRK